MSKRLRRVCSLNLEWFCHRNGLSGKWNVGFVHPGFFYSSYFTHSKHPTLLIKRPPFVVHILSFLFSVRHRMDYFNKYLVYGQNLYKIPVKAQMFACNFFFFFSHFSPPHVLHTFECMDGRTNHTSTNWFCVKLW